MKELGKHVKIIVSDTLPNKLNNQDNNRHFEVELNSLIQFKHKYFNIKFVGKKKHFFDSTVLILSRILLNKKKIY